MTGFLHEEQCLVSPTVDHLAAFRWSGRELQHPEQQLALAMLGSPLLEALVAVRVLAAAVQECAAAEECVVACNDGVAQIPEELESIARRTLEAAPQAGDADLSSAMQLVREQPSAIATSAVAFRGLPEIWKTSQAILY